MARPPKHRRVCCEPLRRRFGPLQTGSRNSEITMTVEEYETIRLIDLEGCTQEECAVRMEVARSTVQGIYGSARKILADLLVNGKMLIIEGGNYALCQHFDEACGRGCRADCPKRCLLEKNRPN